MAITRLLTAEDLEEMGSKGERKELFGGVLRDRDGAGLLHGEAVMELVVSMGTFVRAHGLGRVFPSPTHFVVSRNPDTVLVADAAFVRAERLPSEADLDRFGQVPPELAVEVVDPWDLYIHIVEKIACYQAANVPLVWLVAPCRRVVTVFALGQPQRTLNQGDTLDGGNVIPGFTLPVADIFR